MCLYACLHGQLSSSSRIELQYSKQCHIIITIVLSSLPSIPYGVQKEIFFQLLDFNDNPILIPFFHKQIAYSLIKEQEGQKKVPDDYISFVGLLADPQFGGNLFVLHC